MLDQIKKLIPLFSVADYNATSSYASYFKSLKIEINRDTEMQINSVRLLSHLGGDHLYPA